MRSRHFLDVGAGGDSALIARNDDGADRRVGVEDRELGFQVAHQGVAEGVECLRAVEADQADAIVGFGQDVGFVGHGGDLAGAGGLQTGARPGETG